MITTIHTVKGIYPVSIVPINGPAPGELSYGVKLLGETVTMRYNFEEGRFMPVLPLPIDEAIIAELAVVLEELEQ